MDWLCGGPHFLEIYGGGLTHEPVQCTLSQGGLQPQVRVLQDFLSNSFICYHKYLSCKLGHGRSVTNGASPLLALPPVWCASGSFAINREFTLKRTLLNGPGNRTAN